MCARFEVWIKNHFNHENPVIIDVLEAWPEDRKIGRDTSTPLTFLSKIHIDFFILKAPFLLASHLYFWKANLAMASAEPNSYHEKNIVYMVLQWFIASTHGYVRRRWRRLDNG